MTSRLPRRERDRGRVGEAKMADRESPPPLPAPTAWVSEIVAEVKLLLEGSLTSKLQPIVDKLDSVDTRLETLQGEFSSYQQRLTTLEDQVQHCEGDHQQIRAQLVAMEAKLEDLENRSRRGNLRLIGLSESVKDGELHSFLETWLQRSLALSTAHGPLRIERAHRLGPLGEPGSRARTVILKLLNSAHKQEILRAIRTSGPLMYDNSRVLCFQDYSPALQARRKEFTPICSQLYQMKVPFALLYPARLRIRHAGQTRFFTVAAEALRFLHSMQAPDPAP